MYDKLFQGFDCYECVTANGCKGKVTFFDAKSGEPVEVDTDDAVDGESIFGWLETSNWLGIKSKKAIKKRLRTMIIRLVLATDMAVSFQEVGKANNVFQEDVLDLKKKNHVLQIMVMVIKLSDVSHPARNFETHFKWTQRCVEEFYLQGDKEKNLLISSIED